MRATAKCSSIMSHKNDVIADRIIKEMDRGLTFLKSRSGYLKQDGEDASSAPCVALRCSASVRSSARKIPMRSSSSAMPGEIAGEGFKPVRSDDRTLGEIIKAIRKTGDKPGQRAERINPHRKSRQAHRLPAFSRFLCYRQLFSLRFSVRFSVPLFTRSVV